MELTKEEARLVVVAIDAVHFEGVGFGSEEKPYLELVEKIYREFPDLTDAEVLGRF